MEKQVDSLKTSAYPVLKDVIKRVRASEPLAVVMPELGKPFDNQPILRCQKTIDPGVYLVVLEDMTMFYIEEV